MIFVTEKPTVYCLIAKFEQGHWRTMHIAADDAYRYLRQGWLNYMRDPFDLEALRRWEMDDREERSRLT